MSASVPCCRLCLHLTAYEFVQVLPHYFALLVRSDPLSPVDSACSRSPTTTLQAGLCPQNHVITALLRDGLPLLRLRMLLSEPIASQKRWPTLRQSRERRSGAKHTISIDCRIAKRQERVCWAICQRPPSRTSAPVILSYRRSFGCRRTAFADSSQANPNNCRHLAEFVSVA